MKILALFDKKRRAQVIKNELKRKYGYVCEIGTLQTGVIKGVAISEYPLIFIKERRLNV